MVKRSQLVWAMMVATILVCLILPNCIVTEIDNLFYIEDFKNLPGFLEKLRKGEDQVSRYVLEQFSTETREWIQNRDNTDIAQFSNALVKEMNEILELKSLYNKRRFAHLQIPPDVNKMLLLPREAVVIRLNRALLQCAYPEEIVNKPDYWIHPPTLRSFLLFGTYKYDNLMSLVMKAANITFYISFFALVFSVFLGIFFIFLGFHPYTRMVWQKIIAVLVYFPRLLFLIFLATLLRLQETSHLALSPSHCVILMLGFTGSLFLASQTAGEVNSLRDALFVHFASSLRISMARIFFRHILRNCTAFPISVVKQMRDNILFVSILTFIGVVQFQPTDLGGMIYEYSRSPEAYSSGWWILFFPCAFLCWMVLLFDWAGNQTARYMEKPPLIAKV